MSRLLCVLFSTCTTDERVVWLRLAHDYELKQFASGLRSGSLFIKAPPEWNLRYGRSPLKRDVLLIYSEVARFRLAAVCRERFISLQTWQPRCARSIYMWFALVCISHLTAAPPLLSVFYRVLGNGVHCCIRLLIRTPSLLTAIFYIVVWAPLCLDIFATGKSYYCVCFLDLFFRKHFQFQCTIGLDPRTVTWLILPVVICLSQRLSHACLSINTLYCETANGSLNQLSFIWWSLATWIPVVILELIHATTPDSWKGGIY